jgi:hypothetical protein
MEVKCIYCGQMNGNDAEVCIGCGRTLPPSPYDRTEPGTPLWGTPPDPPPPQPVWTPEAPPTWAPTAPPPAPTTYGRPAPPWPETSPYGPPGIVAYGEVPADVAEAQRKAKTAMILGIIGVPCCGVVLGPLALYGGLQSRGTLLRYGVEDGQGMAMAGIVLGTVDIILALMQFLAWLAG